MLLVLDQRPLMADTTPRTSTTNSGYGAPSIASPLSFSLIQPSKLNSKKQKRRVFQAFRSVFRSFPIINPSCKFPGLPTGSQSDWQLSNIGTRVTGTLFGYRKGKVSLSIQEAPRCLPSLVIELALQTNVLQRELGAGMVRIALECEKQQTATGKDNVKALLDEPLWSMFCNGKKTGHGIKREANTEDLYVMELLKAVSMGAGVLPGNSESEGVDGELAYIRAYFDRVVGSKDSETYYMLSPDGNSGPELSIFLVRI